MPPGPAWLVVPLESPGGGVVHQGHAGLVAEAVGAEGAVGLGAVGAALGPVVELEYGNLLHVYCSQLFCTRVGGLVFELECNLGT